MGERNLCRFPHISNMQFVSDSYILSIIRTKVIMNGNYAPRIPSLGINRPLFPHFIYRDVLINGFSLCFGPNVVAANIIIFPISTLDDISSWANIRLISIAPRFSFKVILGSATIKHGNQFAVTILQP